MWRELSSRKAALQKIKIRTEKYPLLKELWEKLNEKVVIMLNGITIISNLAILGFHALDALLNKK